MLAGYCTYKLSSDKTADDQRPTTKGRRPKYEAHVRGSTPKSQQDNTRVAALRQMMTLEKKEGVGMYGNVHLL